MRAVRERILAELSELQAMPEGYRDANGGEKMRRLGISDWMMEDVIVLQSLRTGIEIRE